MPTKHLGRALGAAVLLALGSSATADTTKAPASPRPLAEFQAAANQFKVRFDVPVWEKTPEEMKAAVDAALDAAGKALNATAALPRDGLTVANTVAALDDILYGPAKVWNRVGVIEQTHPDKAFREAATVQNKRLAKWFTEVGFREDIYQVAKAFAATSPQLAGEDGLSPDVEDTKDTHEWLCQNNQSNIDFIHELARRHGYEVDVTDHGMLHFAKPKSEAGKLLTLTWGENLKSFYARSSVANVEARWSTSRGSVRGQRPESPARTRPRGPRPAESTGHLDPAGRRDREPGALRRSRCAVRNGRRTKP